MDLRQLTYLVAVAESGGVRPAARRLSVAQPSISSALRALERELGVALLLRTSRGVELTPAGVELVQRGRDLIAGFGSAREAVQRIAQETAGTLRIGMVAGIVSAGELLPSILSGFRERRPEVALQLDEVPFVDQLGPLLDGAADIVLVRGPFDRGPLAHPDVTVVPIAEEPRMLLVAADHELAGERFVRAEDVLHLPTLPLAAPDDWAGFWQLDELRGGPRTDGRVRPVATIADVQIAVALQGVVVSTAGAVVRLRPNPLVCGVPLEGAPRCAIGVACRRDDRRARVREFVGSAQDAAAEHLQLLPGATLPA